jgi:glucose/arabinose dehydrogenase
VADIAGFEANANPDGCLPDSNPHSVTTKWGRAYVADAGGNSLLKVSRHGEISTTAVFPDQRVDAPPGLPPMAQAVPTSVVVGPDGALYVGQLTGFPFVPGAANVFRIEPGSPPEVYASGFTNVTGIDFDRHGRLYVVEFASNGILSGDPTGALIRVNPDGSRETLVSEGLVNPTGVVVGRKGVYVSNHGAEAGAGEVLRFRF